MSTATRECLSVAKEPTQASLAYLVSEYPGVSHTFILREIRRLRAMKCDIRVASINQCRRPATQLTEEERQEMAATYYVKSAGVTGALRAHWFILLSRPIAYLRGLVFALRLAGGDIKRLLFAIFYFVEAVMLGRWMERQGLHHVHVHFANPAAQVALIASRVFAVRYSLTVHGPDEFYDTQGHNLTEKIAGASFVCCISYFAISQLKLLSPPSEWSKFELTPLGVDPKVFAPCPFRFAPEPFEILCVGRLVAAKGQHILIEAIDRLVHKDFRVRLRLVGDGPERKPLELEVRRRGLSQHVIFEGSVNQDRIGEFYRRADVFVLASFAEGVPVVLMEAMAMEIPCVTTYVGGIPQLIQNEVDGLLVAPSDVNALTFAIERLVGDPALRIRLATAARERVFKHYNLGPNVSRLRAIFDTRLGTQAVNMVTESARP